MLANLMPIIQAFAALCSNFEPQIFIYIETFFYVGNVG